MYDTIKINTEETKENYVTSNEFFQATIKKQRAEVKRYIKEAMDGPNSTIYLPFRLYVEIAKELEAFGWKYDAYQNSEKKIFTMLCVGNRNPEENKPDF